MERLVPTWGLLQKLPVRRTARVPLARVMRQRRAFIDVATGALRDVALETLLRQAVERGADGVAAEMAKIAALQPDGSLLIVAGRNLHPDVVGKARLATDGSNPAGQCVTERRIVNIPDLRRRPEYRLPSLYAGHGVISTVNVPIMLDTGPFGVFEIDAAKPHAFDDLDLSFLIGIAGVIGEGVARVRREAALNEELDAREILMREHHHRVRNQYQVLSSVLRLQAREASTANSRERFLAIERRVFALASLYDHLLSSDHAGTVLLQDYMGSLCDSMREFYAMAERNIALMFRPASDILVDIDVASTLGLVINELVANSIEHAFDAAGGEIVVAIDRGDPGTTTLSVSDNGAGYAAGREDATGMTTVRRLLARLGAMIEASDGNGTRWEIRVPTPRLQSRSSIDLASA